MSRPQIGLFGGSFNPPHVCHAQVSLWALQARALDAVWWVPTYQHAFGKSLASFEDRVAMCELAVRPLHHVEVCAIERELGGESRTIDTVRALRARHPDADFSLIVGADILGERHKWKDWDGLMGLLKGLIVVGRAGYDDQLATAPDAPPIFSLPHVSSSAIRAALGAPEGDASRQFLRDWVPHRVLDYITAHDLYAGREQAP